MPNLRGLLALAALLAGASAFAQSAVIASTNPSTLNQANLRTAWIAVNLTSATYTAGAAPSHFTLTTTIPGLAVNSLWFNSGRDGAILYLHWDGSDFDAAATIGVTVDAAATTHNAALTTTNTAAVGVARWVNVSTTAIALAEGGSAGAYTVALESPPTGNVTVTVTSDNAAVTVGGAASTTLTFTTTNWATAQSVSVAPVDDNSDTVDELALVTNVATGGGYSSSTVADRTVRVTVADDDTRTGTDYDADDDQLIEIDSLAKLNAIRWDLDGDGAASSGNATAYAAAFPSAAAGMGCPDSGDADQTSNCTGYELTADLDFDTNGDGSVDAADTYTNWTPIGGSYTGDFDGNNHTISNLTTSRSGQNVKAGLFLEIGSGAVVSNLELVNVAVHAANSVAGALAADIAGTVAAVSVRGGTISAGAVAGGLAGQLLQGGVVKACYTTAAVSGPTAGGMVGRSRGTIAASYAHGTVTGSSATLGRFGGLVGHAWWGESVTRNSYATGAVTGSARPGDLEIGGLVGYAVLGASAAASYWDSQTTGQSSSALGTTQTTSGLQTPTAYGAGAADIYAYWDDYDTDGDGRIGAEDDAWHFGQANQYPVLKWGGHSPTAQFAAQLVGQTDTAPSYAGISVSAKTYAFGTAIQPFQIPAPTGGNGTYDYTVTGLPYGLFFDEDGTGPCRAARTVCGTPRPTSTTVATVTVTVADADANVADSDRATLTFTITVQRPAVVVSPERLALTEGGSGSYTVVLDTAPSATVTVAVASDNAAVTVGASSLTFTTQNWNTAQSVTVTAAGDADAVDEAAAVTNTAASTDTSYNGLSGEVRVVVDDDEATGTDYDADNDGLIEIDSLAKLNAIRWDLNGSGASSNPGYAAAFAGAATGEHMGCPDSDADADGDCAGYELTADLDFDTNGDGAVDASDAYPNWAPIGGDYNAAFHGNNRTISNMTMRGGGERGLFYGLGGSSRVSNLGLIDFAVTSTSGPSALYRGVGALAGHADGTIEAVYVRGGTVSASSGGGRGVLVGGLVGYLLWNGVIRACYSTAAVSGYGVLSPAVGGLVGYTSAPIVASYAAGRVHVQVSSQTGNAGGLVGWAVSNLSVFTNSYARGRISWTGSARRGGLLARRSQSGTAPGSTWDRQTTGQGGGQTTSALQAPTGYTGIYAAWDDHDTNGDGVVDADDDAWDFGNGYHYPVLKYGGMDTASQYNDYDADDDGLVDITTLAQLNAVRWDLDGDGSPSAGNESSYYSGAFNHPVFNADDTGLPCPTTTDDADANDCRGYELLNDLDFDTDGDGSTHTSGTGDAGDAYNNSGMGWAPIGPESTPSARTHFNATFDGNGKLIDNLFVNRARHWSGLFAGLAGNAKVLALGLPDARVQGGNGSVGALAGQNNGHVGAVWASGSVAGTSTVAGLVGYVDGSGSVVASYSTAAVSCTGTSGAGLASSIGSSASVAASYSTGTVTGASCTNKAGFVQNNNGTVTASYWDTGLSAIAGNPPLGRSSSALRTPTAYGATANDIYRLWDEQDVDGDGATRDGDDADPWDFGRSVDHPILKYRGLAAAPQLDAQPDTAPDFGTATVANKTFQNGRPIEAFQIPAAGAGNGVLRYAANGLPAGLSLGTPTCADARTVCGAPTADTVAPVTVTITVSDSDSTVGSGDQDTLTFTVEVVTPTAAITAPAALAEATLNGATVTVALTNAAFEVGATAGNFSLTTNPGLSGLSVASVGTVSAGDTSATLTLGYTGGNFDTGYTFAVTVADSAHTLAGALTTATVNIVPTPSVWVNPTTLTLTEGGSSATYAMRLGSQPTGNVVVNATSDDAAATIDTDATPLTRTLTFTPMDWNTAQTVTVSPADDDDAVDESATINHAVSNYGVLGAASVSVTVEDDEAAAIVIDADPSTATVVDPGPVALREDAMHAENSATYSVKLMSEPTGTVTVTVTSTDAAAVTVDTAAATGLQSTLSFTTTNWDTAQTVTLSAVQDADPNSEEIAIHHEANGGGYMSVEARLMATVADDDVGVIVDTDPNTSGDQTTPLALNEGQVTTYTVRLSTLPVGGNVSVVVASDNPAIDIVAGTSGGTFGSAASLTFTATDWATAQTVRVLAEQDADAVGERGTIANDPVGAQYGSAATINIAATAQDDEVDGADYDTDDDNLIEIDSLAKLNAVRWDLDGDGDVDSSANETSYRSAFAGSIMAEDMGCLDGPDADQEGDCAGYELAAALDFDTDDDGDVDSDDDYPNWASIGGTYSATFDGNNHVISNLTIVDAAGSAGLFNTVSGTVRGLGLADVDVSGVGGSSTDIAPLAVVVNGTVIASWASGRVHVGSTGLARAGGLVGRVTGSGSRLAASYSTASVTGAGNSASYAGGLAALIHNGATVVACYATGLVDEGGSGSVRAGGLIGGNTGPTTVRASYFAGTVAGSGVSGVTAADDGSGENYHNVYYDSGTTGLTAGSAAQTTSALQGPTSATGTLYAAWDDLDVNGNGTADEDPWDFGTAYNHPALNYGGLDPVAQRTDYDADGDGLIDITTLGQLNAVRWDLDGNGAPSTGNETSFHAAGAFLNPRFQPGGAGLCPTTGDDADDDDCRGYELLNDLDFDTNGNGATWTAPGGTVTGDTGDAYNNAGAGWMSIGSTGANTAANYTATFDGNGHVIDNLFINRGTWLYQGLFAGTTASAVITSLGLPNVRIQAAQNLTGGLVGVHRGRIAAVWSSGTVRAGSAPGGLVGGTTTAGARVVASYSAAAVECTSGAGSAVAGGLVGYHDGGLIAASYSTGRVTGACPAGNKGALTLVGSGTVAASYWDTTLSQIADDTENPPRPPEGRTTAVLQAPTDYDTIVGSPGEALYAAWDDQDVDGDGVSGEAEDDDPWDFGRPNQHPILKYRGLAAAPQLDAQPDTAPAFATSTLAAMTFPGGVAIQPFQLPAVTAGNGAYVYTPSGLPAGLSLGTPDCARRTVCGTPTAATSTTVTVTVSDSDSNMAAGDRDAVTFMVTVPPASARIAGTVPAPLTETNLHSATVRVELSGTVFAARIAPSSFQLVATPPIAGLSIASATRASDTEASLRLRFDRTNFDTQATLLVRVLAAAHRFGGDQETGTVAVAPAIGVMVSATELTLEEEPGSTNANYGSYTVALTGQPPGVVTVTPTSSNPDVTLSGSVSFNATTWNSPATVGVTAGRDDDAVDDVAHITHAVQGIPGVASGPRVRVAVNDDDSQGLTLDAATLTASGVTEGMTATYTAVLDSEPTGPVTVAISSSEGAVTVDTDSGAAGAQDTLLFHAMNWDTAQTVTVRAAEDDDGEGGTATLTHAVSGADYSEVEDADVSFAVADNDMKGATLSTTALNVQENGTAEYTLVLDTEPVGGAVSVPLGVGVAANTVTRSPSALTFTARNWDAPQTVTVTGVDDANTGNEIVALGHAPTGGGYDGVSISNINVTAVDDDVAGLKVSPVNLTVAEGATATYTVRLNVAPTGTVAVTVGGATAKLTADTDTGTPGDQTTLSFDAANWDTARTVTVTAVADDDGADETVGLSHTVTGTGDYAALAAIRRPGVSVLVRDDETAGVVLAPTSLAIDEGGTATYEVSLSAPPASGTTTIAIASAGAAGLTVDASTLSFTGTTWDTARTVTVTAVADHARLTDAEGTLTHAVSGYGAVDSGPDLPVRVANTTVDHDADADGLIEIDSLAKLNAMRWDLDGDGTSATTSYAAAFPNARGGGVCPTATSGVACRGFELTTDLDFDTDGDGRTWTETGGVVSGDDGDQYYNGGAGWEPVGDATAIPSSYYRAVFRGNGHVVGNLFVNRNRGATGYAGLFGLVVGAGRIESLGLVDGYARDRYSGLLAGFSNGAVAGCYSTGRVVATDAQFAAGGGLIGVFGSTGGGHGSVAASYSTARVTSAHDAGGLVGRVANPGTATIDSSWAAGRVSGASGVGGLVGAVVDNAAATTASYYDNVATGQTTSARGVGQSTADLRRPTGYTGIYATWDVDLDGDYEADDPWDFGSSSQYPSLKWRGFDVTKQFVGLLSFASVVSGRSFTVGRPIALFQVPAAAGGEGTVRYSARGLPPGLVFDADGRGQCGLARSVCGTPSEAGTWTATVTARDGAGATAALTISMEVLGADAAPEEEPAAVPDEALREAVARALGRDGGAVTESDLLSLGELDASWSGVSNLAGLSLATNLRRLVLAGNALSDLSELSGLRLLAYLDLSDNALSDLSALSGLTRLETLLLSGNRVSDISPLRGMAGLKALVLDGNAVSDLAHMVFLESLEELSLSGNPLEGLSPLCSLRELKWLWLAGSGLSDIAELSCLSGLERLWLSDNAVEDVGPLSGMRRLAWLDLERNAVSGVDALRRLEALARLRLGSNRVSDAGPLAANGGLGEGDVAGLRGNPLSEESIRRHVPALRERGVSVLAGLSSPWFASAGDAAGRQSFVRLVNRSEVAGEALVWGLDDAGARFGPARLAIGAGRTAHFNSEDLERGNAAKGLTDGIGAPMAGDWRLEILSTLDLEAQTFLRAPGGPLSALHDGLPRVGETLRAAFLPAGRERSPAGALRVSNPTGADETVMVWGFDDAGRGRLATGLVAPAGRAVTVSASDLERWRLGAGRGLGRGEGNWRLELAAPWPLAAQALAVGDDGRTGNLSGAAAALGPGVVARVPLFPPASATGRVGVARVWNLGAAAGEVLVTAVDDAGVRAGPVALALEAFAAAEFDSRELEEGGGPLAEGVGAPTRGSWRLELRAQFGARVHARAVGAGGYATGLLEAAPRSGGAARVSVFNPGSNQTQRSLLRLANDGAEDAMATIGGVDDAGRAGGAVGVTVPAGEALWLSAAELESGGDGFEGSLGDGEGKWRLTVSSTAPLAVMSLVEDEQGALSNLSTPGRR